MSKCHHLFDITRINGIEYGKCRYCSAKRNYGGLPPMARQVAEVVRARPYGPVEAAMQGSLSEAMCFVGRAGREMLHDEPY